MIRIPKSPTADTRACDFSKVTHEQLLESSKQHILDVQCAINLFKGYLSVAASDHDRDKIVGIWDFYSDFKTNFKNTAWWDNHRRVSRHHLNSNDGVPEDVNLIDVLEMIADCVMAGMARSGKVTPLTISPDVLMRAFQNTSTLLQSNVEVEDEYKYEDED